MLESWPTSHNPRETNAQRFTRSQAHGAHKVKRPETHTLTSPQAHRARSPHSSHRCKENVGVVGEAGLTRQRDQGQRPSGPEAHRRRGPEVPCLGKCQLTGHIIRGIRRRGPEAQRSRGLEAHRRRGPEVEETSENPRERIGLGLGNWAL